VEPHEVDEEARGFARRLSDLLNATVCTGLRLTAARLPTGYVRIGLGINRHDLRARPLPLQGRVGHGVPLYLTLTYTLSQDDQGEHLMVVSSVVGTCLDPDGRRELFHADYERGKANYPEAHLQVCASSDDWDAVMADRDGDPLKKLHLPAGGRRYRTTVEDVIEFLVFERLVCPHDGWAEALGRSRDDFAERQLRAAVRRHPEIARDVLRRLPAVE